MPEGSDFEFSDENSGSSPNFNGGKVKRIRKSFFSKKKICLAVFVFVTVLIILCFLKFKNPSKIQKAKKTKRYLRTNEFCEEPDEIKKLKNDIEIIPENGRTDHHPNRRYTGKEGENRTAAEGVIARADWLPFEPDTNKRPGVIRGVTSKEEFARHQSKGQGQSPNEILKNSGYFMRLKGVYVQSENEEDKRRNQFDENYYYSKEINNLMQAESVGGGGGGELSVKKTFRSHGEPFRLQTRGRQSLKRQKAQSAFRFNQFSKKNPITIYLDFYPIKDSKDLERKSRPDSNVLTRQENKFHSPASSQSVDAAERLPHDKRNGMVMKLVLYPNQVILSDRDLAGQTAGFQAKQTKRAGKKPFRWFYRHKRKMNHPQQCSILGKRSRGRHVPAKDKNGDGEWVHTQNVAIRYSKRGKD